MAVHDTATPTVPEAGQLIATPSVNGLIVTVADAVAVCEALSVKTTLIVLVPFVL